MNTSQESLLNIIPHSLLVLIEIELRQIRSNMSYDPSMTLIPKNKASLQTLGGVLEVTLRNTRPTTEKGCNYKNKAERFAESLKGVGGCTFHQLERGVLAAYNEYKTLTGKELTTYV